MLASLVNMYAGSWLINNITTEAVDMLTSMHQGLAVEEWAILRLSIIHYEWLFSSSINVASVPTFLVNEFKSSSFSWKFSQIVPLSASFAPPADDDSLFMSGNLYAMLSTTRKKRKKE